MIEGILFGLLNQIDASAEIIPSTPTDTAPTEPAQTPPAPSHREEEETPSFHLLEMLHFAVIPTLLVVCEELLRDQK